METILISALFAVQIHYADPQTCQDALEVVLPKDPEAFCIPAGKSKEDIRFEKFLGLIKEFSAQNPKKSVDN